MYQCNLNIIVVSGSYMLEAAVKSVALPEDCKVIVSTVPELTEKPEKLDSAVIFDGLSAYEKGSDLVGKKALRVLLADCGSLREASVTANKPDELWTVPSDYNEDTLLVFYSEKLISRMKEAFDYRMQKICFNTAFDSIPDLVWFKDVKGAHLIVNDGFCGAVAKTKEQIYKKGHYYIWDIPKEEYEQGDYVCLESEEVIMNARKTCLFDEKVKTKQGMRQFKTYKSPLIDEDGTIIGTCGIAKDVTAQHNINSELEVILDSMPFAVIIDDKQENVIAANRLFHSYFPEYSDIVGTNLSSWKNSVMRGKLEDNEIEIETEKGMLNVSCRIKPIHSIFNEIIGNAIILTDITSEKRRFEQNAANANTDYLTGLANRKRLFEYFDSIKYSPSISALAIDLDNFKEVNDKYGHTAGDSALVLTANILRKTFPIDFIARMSGDDFIVIINGACPGNELRELAEELLSEINGTFSDKSDFGEISASIGAAVSTVSGGNVHNIETILNHTGEALSKAKSTGKNKLFIYGEQSESC